MDINYLLHREQVEIVRADGSANMAAQCAHRELAALYRAQIDEYRASHLQPNRAPLPR